MSEVELYHGLGQNQGLGAKPWAGLGLGISQRIKLSKILIKNLQKLLSHKICPQGVMKCPKEIFEDKQIQNQCQWVVLDVGRWFIKLGNLWARISGVLAKCPKMTHSHDQFSTEF